MYTLNLISVWFLSIIIITLYFLSRHVSVKISFIIFLHFLFIKSIFWMKHWIRILNGLLCFYLKRSEPYIIYFLISRGPISGLVTSLFHGWWDWDVFGMLVWVTPNKMGLISRKRQPGQNPNLLRNYKQECRITFQDHDKLGRGPFGKSLNCFQNHSTGLKVTLILIPKFLIELRKPM